MTLAGDMTACLPRTFSFSKKNRASIALKFALASISGSI